MFMKQLVLIGASGFVGSAILKEALSRGHQVTGVVRNPVKLKVTHPNFTLRPADVSTAETVAEVCSLAEVVVSAYNPGWNNPNIYEDTLRVYPEILKGVKKSGVDRLMVVGGGGSLFVSPGVRLMDTGAIPLEFMPGVRSLATFYFDFLMPEQELDWVFFSPAAMLVPGERTGVYRLGKDDLIVDAEGKSTISVEDYAKAMIDEIEQPTQHKERFTIGYL
jgi:putative NADH-flavin reductase